MTRVTHLSLTSTYLRNLAGVANRIEQGQIKLTTGLNFQRPSDNPLAINQVLGFRTQITSLAQFQTNVTDGQSQVDFLDSKIRSLAEQIRDSRTLALQGRNDTLARPDRLAIGGQIDQTLRDLVLLGNTQLNGRYLFAGSRTLHQPFEEILGASDGQLADVRYVGNQQSIARRIADGSRFDVNFTGDTVFLEQTYTRQGTALPTDIPLGFSGTLVIDGTEVAVTATDTLPDIAQRINLKTDLAVSARIRGGTLELFSDYAVKEFALKDLSNGDLLTDLGLNVRGAYTQAQSPVDPLGLPLIDSTPAIFTAAGPVTNLSIDGSNDILNLHLGAAANEGTPLAHVVRIPHGVYATAADLATAIQTAVDDAFGRNKIVVAEVGGALELRTFRNGAGIGLADLQIGGTIDGQVDTASDAATLNLFAGPGPTPLTNATTGGTDGTDQFAIDLGPLVSATGLDEPPIVLDLRAANTTGVGALVAEINAQIRADVRLRGAVEARLEDGRIVFETLPGGKQFGADQLQLVEVIPGVLTQLGDFTDRPATLTGDSAPTVPFVVTDTNRSFTIDLGPSTAKSGYNIPAKSFVLPLGTYTTAQELRDILNGALIQQPEIAGQVEFVTEDATPTSRLILRTTGTGSNFRAEDLAVGGLLVSDFGFATATAQDGAGVAAGTGMTLEPRNVFRDLIATRDDLTDLADAGAIAKELTDVNGVGLGLFDGDDITLTFNGRTVTFPHRAGETLGSLVSEFNRILGGDATFAIARDGRLTVTNHTDAGLANFSLSAASPRGVPRTGFNAIMAEFASTLPARGTLQSGVMLDPRRRDRTTTAELGKLDQDLEHALGLASVVGARSNRLTLTSSVILDSTFTLQGLKTGLEAVNIPEIITRLSADQATLEAALQVGSRVLQPSLIAFLR